MIRLERTNSENIDFIALVKQLDAYLAVVDGNLHSFYDQYNGIEALKHVVLAYEDDKAVGCGAMKTFGTTAMEIKRMFVPEEYRSKGIAGGILAELESWTSELGYKECILETGQKQVEAISLYQKNGYTRMPNFGPYEEVENSSCFKKDLL